MIGRALAPVAILLTLSSPARAACEDGHCRNYPRDPAVTHAVTLTVPCPATGEVGHRCPGFIRDHFIPLCAAAPMPSATCGGRKPHAQPRRTGATSSSATG